MARRSKHLSSVAKHPLAFLGRVVSGFRDNQGFLLAGAVAYNTLLSIVPMLALILVVLSQMLDQQLLLDTTRAYLELVAPGEAAAVMEQIQAFLGNWKVVGIVGVLALVFFSSLAFTVLENAMSVIFHHRVRIRRRRFLISAIIPYAYIMVLALGLLIVSAVSGGLHAMGERTVTLLGQAWSLGGMASVLAYVLGVIGEILLLTSLYLVMPVGRLNVSHALIGGLTATVLWEVSRHLLVWYFSTLSLVNVIYGSFATVIIILLSLEVAAIILLLGAQVIAEYERAGLEEEGTGGLRT